MITSIEQNSACPGPAASDIWEDGGECHISEERRETFFDWLPRKARLKVLRRLEYDTSLCGLMDSRAVKSIYKMKYITLISPSCVVLLFMYIWNFNLFFLRKRAAFLPCNTTNGKHSAASKAMSLHYRFFKLPSDSWNASQNSKYALRIGQKR